MPSDTHLFALLADAILLLHAAFVLFVVGGQVLILAGWALRWRWVRGPVFRYTHLAAIGYVVAEAWLGVVCPLTTLENHFRQIAGGSGYGRSFIGYWVGELLFYQAPPWVFTAAYTLFALVTVASLIGYPPLPRGGKG